MTFARWWWYHQSQAWKAVDVVMVGTSATTVTTLLICWFAGWAAGGLVSVLGVLASDAYWFYRAASWHWHRVAADVEPVIADMEAIGHKSPDADATTSGALDPQGTFGSLGAEDELRSTRRILTTALGREATSDETTLGLAQEVATRVCKGV
jgi:hypothetical protein